MFKSTKSNGASLDGCMTLVFSRSLASMLETLIMWCGDIGGSSVCNLLRARSRKLSYR